MEQATMIMMSVEDLRNTIREEVEKAIGNQQQVQGKIKELPALLNREQFMELMQISSTTATRIFERPDFRVFRKGKLLIETDFLFEWIRKNSDWVEENTSYFNRSIS